MGVNIKVLREEINRQSEKTITPKISKILNKRFLDTKQEMLEEFNSDPITQEIEAGPLLENSLFVDTKAGGNLFSFLGFSSNERPTEDLRKMLTEQATKGKVEKRINGDKIEYKLEVRAPSLSDIEKETKTLPWTSRSWVNAVQRGIGGFPNYLFNKLGFKNSNSGTAIETPNKIRDGSFRGVDYISKILNNFKRNLKNK